MDNVRARPMDERRGLVFTAAREPVVLIDGRGHVLEANQAALRALA